jgi:hypothetical protein
MPLGAAKAAFLGAAGTVAAAGDFEWIASTTFDGSTSTHTFSAIPQTYNSLKIVLYVKPTSPTFRPYIRINGETGSNYKMVEFSSSSGSFYSGEITSSEFYIGYTPTASVAMVLEADLDGYTNSSMFSPVQHMWGSLNGSDRPFGASQGNYQSGTAAITSVEVYDSSGDDPAAGSTVALFGFKDA